MNMNMNITTPKSAAKPRNGKVLYGERFLSRVELAVTKLEGKKLVRNPNCHFNLADLGIATDALEAQVVYGCPWTENKYYWMFPLGVVTDDEKRYGLDISKEPWMCRLISASERSMDHVDPSEWCKVTDAMLGHGYTTGTLPSDGHGHKVLATVPLDNGDEILVVCWVWFNK